MIANEGVLARIKELQTAVAVRVVDCEIRRRFWRGQFLQNEVDRMAALIEARSVMYGGQMGEARHMKVIDTAQEAAAIAEGFAMDGADVHTEYPKTLYHPGFPNGGATGLLVKDYRGKNAEQEIWKFDGGLVGKLNDTLKQAAIEEGQWTEKREMSDSLSISVMTAHPNDGK